MKYRGRGFYTQFWTNKYHTTLKLGLDGGWYAFGVVLGRGWHRFGGDLGRVGMDLLGLIGGVGKVFLVQ